MDTYHRSYNRNSMQNEEQLCRSVDRILSGFHMKKDCIFPIGFYEAILFNQARIGKDIDFYKACKKNGHTCVTIGVKLLIDPNSVVMY